MTKLSEYEIRFRQNRLLGFWSWTAKAPNGDELASGMMSVTKEGAEAEALRHIQRHASAETVDGEALKQRVLERQANLLTETALRKS